MTDPNGATTTIDLSGDGTEPGEPAPSGPTLTITAGDNQTAQLLMTAHGFPMATFDPIVVVLRDAGGAPMAGHAVSWAPGETPGNMGIQLDPRGTSPLVLTTDDEGVAVLDQMRGRSLSAFYQEGSFQLIARSGPASASATLTVVAPLEITAKIVGGDNQAVARSGNKVFGGEARFAPVTIRLKDSEGALVAGVKVVFEAAGPGGMTIQLTPGYSDTDVLTDADGLATLNLMDGDGIVCSGADGDFKIVVTPAGGRPVISHQSVVA